MREQVEAAGAPSCKCFYGKRKVKTDQSESLGEESGPARESSDSQ